METNEKNIKQEELHKAVGEKEELPHAQEENIKYINHKVEDIEEENENENEKEKELKKIYKQSQLSYEEEQSQEVEKAQIKSELQPIDSKHKKIESNTQKIQINKKSIKKDEIPRVMVFEKIIDYSIDNDESNRSENEKVIDISKTETQKYSVKRAQGIEKGEYKFEGSEQIFTQKEPYYANVNITKEEVMAEINRRKKKKFHMK